MHRFHGTILLATWVSWTPCGHTVRSSGTCPGRSSGTLSGISSFDSTGCSTHPAPQPVAGRRRLPKRCFGSGCARPVATLKGAGEPHRPPALFAGIDAARQRQTDINPFIFMDLSVVVQARYCFGHRNVQENASIRTSRDATPNALRRTVR